MFVSKKIRGKFFTDRGLVNGSSYQQPRRGRGRKKQRKATGAWLFSIAVCGALFVNFSSEFNGSTIRNAKV